MAPAKIAAHKNPQSDISWLNPPLLKVVVGGGLYRRGLSRKNVQTGLR